LWQLGEIDWRIKHQPRVFLASGDSDYVTGADYSIDGGLMRNVGQGATLGNVAGGVVLVAFVRSVQSQVPRR